jgi:hypothetical protein
MKRASETRNEKPVIELVKMRRRAELQFVTRLRLPIPFVFFLFDPGGVRAKLWGTLRDGGA